MATPAESQRHQQAPPETLPDSKQGRKMKAVTNKAAIRLHDRWDGKLYLDHAVY